MDKINWDDMDIDIKGLAYEHFLKSEMGGGDLGQFFTKSENIGHSQKYSFNFRRMYLRL